MTDDVVDIPTVRIFHGIFTAGENLPSHFRRQ
jgi:hypothetical protein